MARKLRVQYPGAIYHVMSRGDRREPIFKDDLDRRRFLETLAQTCAKTSWQVHAYCLMENHFHLVVETPRANLVAGMKWFLGTYTSRFNRRHKLFGHLFSGRYKALLVDGSGNGYLRTVCDYVHLNPLRANLLTDEQPLRSFVWSSYGQYLQASGQRPACGCEWTGCWGRRASRRTAWRAAGRLNGRWKNAATATRRASGTAWSAAGILGTRNSGRNCWRRWSRNWGGIMAGRSGRKPMRRGPSDCWAKNCDGGAGLPGN